MTAVNNNLVGAHSQKFLYSSPMADAAIKEAISLIQEALLDLQWSQGELARRTIQFAKGRGIDINLSQQSVANFLSGNVKRLPPWVQFVVGAIDEERAPLRLADRAVQYRAEPGSLGSWRTATDRPPTRSASHDDGAIEVRQVDLSYAMGDGANLDDYPDEIGVKFDHNFLRTLTRAAPSALFVARGNGDSMQPTLINDDMVLIDTTQRTLNMQDRIWACALHGAGMIKRLRIVGEGRIEVISDNSTVNAQTVEADDLHIVGRVIWVGRRV